MNQGQQQTVEILNLTVLNFRAEVINDPSPILIDFWASWCGPCRMMAPIFHEAAVALHGEVRAAKINVDNEAQLAEAFGIKGIPALVLMQGGKVLDAWSGVTPAGVLVGRVRTKIAGG